VGRFISEDPYKGNITNPLSLNLYIYCSNNPVIFIDPSGLKQLLKDKYKNAKITWNNKKKVATVYVNGKKIYYSIDNKKIRLENGHVVIYSKDPTNDTTVLMSKENRKPGKTPPKSWPSLLDKLAGKKPKWNPNGYWEGKNGDYTWDNRSHGTGVDRGNGPQDGHWDDENSDRRWSREGELLPIFLPIPARSIGPIPPSVPASPIMLFPQKVYDDFINTFVPMNG
jgi:hypothetical protein